MKKKLKSIFEFIKQMVNEIGNDNIFKYSASLAYYTIFALAPMLIIIIAICSFFFGREAMQGEIYGQIKQIVGSDAALQIQNTIKNSKLSTNTPIATVVSMITLVLGATGIFGEIQDSLNKIWGLKIKPKKNSIWKIVLNRLLSFSLILSLGFVLIVSLLLNAIIISLGNKLNHFFSGVVNTLIPVIDNLISFIVTTILFAAIFKILPDARIKWKDVGIGALITSMLFMLGKFLIGCYLVSSKLTTIYGAAGSVIILLSWTYYSAAILYIGAEFTKVYIERVGNKIFPNDYSVWIKTEEVEVKEKFK
ncbi:MAG: YihY/virulence factor BrkB family protein [Ferruginibacter sp.]